MLIRSFNSSQIYFIVAKVETFMKTEKNFRTKNTKTFLYKRMGFHGSRKNDRLGVNEHL